MYYFTAHVFERFIFRHTHSDLNSYFTDSLIHFPICYILVCCTRIVFVVEGHGFIVVSPFCHPDSSPSSSSTPASGCSSPNDSLHSDNGALPLSHEVSRSFTLKLCHLSSYFLSKLANKDCKVSGLASCLNTHQHNTSVQSSCLTVLSFHYGLICQLFPLQKVYSVISR